MSSGQWEVVGKSKKPQNGKVKTAKDDEKKLVKNGSKIEEYVPNSQLKSSQIGAEVENDKKPPKEIKKKDNDKKPKKQDKKSETPKQKQPKTLEGAIQMIDLSELASIITTNKVRFSNAPLVWLKEVAGFLNSKTQIETDDLTFSNYSNNYPFCLLSKDIKSTLLTLLQDSGSANTQIFFDITLTAVANDMSRGQSVNGYRLLLQMLAHENPEFCTAYLQKYISLRQSYQNRPPIGLTLLWILGQGGFVDFSVGLKVWQQIFLPIIDLKHYSKYIVKYLSKLIDAHKSKKGSISQEQLLSLFDAVNAKRSGVSKDVSSDLIEQLSKLKNIYFASNTSKLQVAFNQILKKLPNQYLTGQSLDPYNKMLLECLIDCLHLDDSCNETWKQLFQKCGKQTATLWYYIDLNYNVVSKRLKLKSLKNTITVYSEVTKDAIKDKKKNETAIQANAICQGLLNKMTSSRRFPWLGASFLLLLTIAGLVAYDVSRVGGDFPKSSTGKLFKDLGILEHSQVAWQKTMSTSARGYIWLETNTPIYYAQTIEVCGPYGQLSKDIFLIAVKKAGILYENIRSYAVEKGPVVATTIEQYAPGLIENVQSYSSAGYEAVKKHSINAFDVSSDYLKTKVFVGEWAPEILQNKTQSALNVTKTQVTTYYHWFRQQVNLYSEIP